MERETDDTGVLLPVFLEGFANGIIALLTLEASECGQELDKDWAIVVASAMTRQMNDRIEEDPVTRLKVEDLIASHVHVRKAV